MPQVTGTWRQAGRKGLPPSAWSFRSPAYNAVRGMSGVCGFAGRSARNSWESGTLSRWGPGGWPHGWRWQHNLLCGLSGNNCTCLPDTILKAGHSRCGVKVLRRTTTQCRMPLYIFVRSEIPVNPGVGKITKCKEHPKMPYFEENRST